MLIDALDTFCSATSAILNNTNAIIGNVRDTQVGTLNTLLANLGSQRLFFVVQCQTTFVGGTSAQFQLVTDSTANLATSKTVHLDTGAIVVATWAAGSGNGAVQGYEWIREIPPDLTFEKYLGVWETTVGSVTAGKINAFLTTDVRRYRAYADAIA